MCDQLRIFFSSAANSSVVAVGVPRLSRNLPLGEREGLFAKMLDF
jgi:hypothetical protein